MQASPIDIDINSISFVQFGFTLGNVDPAVRIEEWFDFSGAVVVDEHHV